MSQKSPLSGLGRRMIIRSFGEPRLYLEGDPTALAYDAEGTLWSVEEPGILREWDEGGRALGRFFLQDLETTWCFSAHAEMLASASDELVVWDVNTQHLLATLPSPEWITAVTFHPKQALVATGHDDGSIRIWDPTKDDPIATFGSHSLPVSALAFSTDGTMLASAGEDRQIHLWSVKAPKIIRTLTGHTDRIPALAWKPGDQILVSAGWDSTARVWDVTTGEPLILLNTHADQVHLLQFAPDGETLVCADSAPSIHIWSDPLNAKVRLILPGYAEEIRAFAISRDGSTLAVAGTDRVIHLWDLPSGKLIAGQNSDVRYAVDLCQVGEHRLIAACGGNAGLHLWDTANGDDRTPAAETSPQHAIVCSRDGRLMATSGPDSIIHLWDAKSLKPIRQLVGPRAATTILAFSADSKILGSACASEGTVWLWNPETAEPILLIPEAAEGASIEALAFHPNGKWLACGGIDWLATSGSDGAVSIWDHTTRERLDTITHGAVGLDFSPDGRFLALAPVGDRAYIWDTSTRSVVKELPGPRDQRITSVSFSPDGKWLIAGGDDNTLRVWSVADWKLNGLREVDSVVRGMHFSPDGDRLFTINNNTTGYEIDVQKLLNGE